MSAKSKPPTYKGRSLGIVLLIAIQLLVGIIHVSFGAILLVFQNSALFQATPAYNIYTLAYGILVLIFTVLIWKGNKAGWAGTVAVSLLVITADTLTLLNLPSIPGIPKSASLLEISYSILVVGYLCTSSVRKKYL